MKEEEQAAVVCVRRSRWERVTEMEELVGRFSFGSRFPQYLLLSVRIWGKGGGGGVLHYSDIDGCCCAGLVDFWVSHSDAIELQGAVDGMRDGIGDWIGDSRKVN